MVGEIVDKAIVFAAQAHWGQRRKYSSIPYIVHPLDVLDILHGREDTDDSMRAAAVLHDVVEDTSITHESIRQQFGEDIAQLVEDLTEVSVVGNRAFRKTAERDRLALVQPRAKVIKLADVISNSRTLGEDDPKFAKVAFQEFIELIRVLQDADQSLAFRARSLIAKNECVMKGGNCRL